ncbi:hypothetical protein M9H77_26505 [Catharanthus roseus]|uniref:Uncharacterized protein n=1 Tax=Catharanthus roseus TaxID=4058 RepID=A0ACC0AB90_CATRO|nr:hypothetical protein M9H77_26505 [Catharanthus roseus]
MKREGHLNFAQFTSLCQPQSPMAWPINVLLLRLELVGPFRVIYSPSDDLSETFWPQKQNQNFKHFGQDWPDIPRTAHQRHSPDVHPLREKQDANEVQSTAQQRRQNCNSRYSHNSIAIWYFATNIQSLNNCQQQKFASAFATKKLQPLITRLKSKKPQLNLDRLATKFHAKKMAPKIATENSIAIWSLGNRRQKL